MSYGAKTSWPEAVGMTGEAAKALIEKEFAGKVHLMPSGCMMTADYQTSRVRVFVSDATRKT